MMKKVDKIALGDFQPNNGWDKYMKWTDIWEKISGNGKYYGEFKIRWYNTVIEYFGINLFR